MSHDQNQIDEILLSEKERIRALVEKDIPAIEALLDENLVHVHTTGKIENYASYLAGVSSNLVFLSINRGATDVRIYGDTAIMTGPLDQRIRIVANDTEIELSSIATQVWVRAGNRWKLASFHACKRD